MLIHMANLEPDVGMGEGTRGAAEDAVETSKRFFVLALLFVDYAEAEKNFVGFVKVELYGRG